MKKVILSILITFVAVCSSFAVPADRNVRNEANWSTLSYENVPVYKVYDSKEAYVVIYEKNKVGVGETVIPKKWAKFVPGESRKLHLRKLPGGKLKSFMTIVKKDGEFKKVILTIPTDMRNPVWGVVNPGKQLEGSDKDTLEELEL